DLTVTVHSRYINIDIPGVHCDNDVGKEHLGAQIAAWALEAVHNTAGPQAAQPFNYAPTGLAFYYNGLAPGDIGAPPHLLVLNPNNEAPSIINARMGLVKDVSKAGQHQRPAPAAGSIRHGVVQQLPTGTQPNQYVYTLWPTDMIRFANHVLVTARKCVATSNAFHSAMAANYPLGHPRHDHHHIRSNFGIKVHKTLTAVAVLDPNNTGTPADDAIHFIGSIGERWVTLYIANWDTVIPPTNQQGFTCFESTSSPRLRLL
ncbi:hypothetical protein HDU85_006873, partial [Gaertneriomyces sp. JEL0708]